MQVILIEPVRNLGNVGDVVKVKNGYARNFLLPTKKALRSTKENVAYFESRKAEIQKENEKNKDTAEKIASAINGSFVALTRQAGEDGRLFGSVTSLDIAREISADGKNNVDRKQVILLTPIKYIGIYEIPVHLHADVTAKINVNIARSSTEAKDAEKRFKRGERVMEGPDGKEAEDNAKAAKSSAKSEAAKSESAAVAAPEAPTKAAEENKEAAPKKAKKKKSEAAETKA